MAARRTSVVAQHVGHVVGGDEGVVDSHHLHAGVQQRGAQHQAADAAKACGGGSRVGVRVGAREGRGCAGWEGAGGPWWRPCPPCW